MTGVAAGSTRQGLGKTAQSFYPLEALSTHLPPLPPAIPLNSPPPSLLPSSPRSSPFPLPASPLCHPHPGSVSSSRALWASAPSITVRRGPYPALSASQAFGAPPAPVSGGPPLRAEPGNLSAEPAGGESPGPPGLGLPVTDSVSMANNLTPTIVWRGQAPGQITRPIRARAAAPHARLE